MKVINDLQLMVQGHNINDLETGIMGSRVIDEELEPLAVAILPENLKHLRENYIDPTTGKMGLTQEELAEILGVSKATVTKWESQKYSSIPSSHALAKMCVMYNTELYFSPKPEKRHPALPELD